MPTTCPTPTHAASRVSDAILQSLSRARGATTVHSIFRSAFNITTGDGLLTIAPSSSGGLPNGIVADLASDFRTVGLRVGMDASMNAQEVRVEAAGLVIDLGGAARWSPRLGKPIGGIDRAAAEWRRRSRLARAIAASVAATGAAGAPSTGRGLGGLLAPVQIDADLGTLERARPILSRIQEAFRDGDRSGASAAARTLVGLGPGLTPSGDDALVGIEAASRALGAPMAGFLGDALDDVDRQTTAVAATLLRHAAAGEFAERLHGLLGALLGPDDAELPRAIDRAAAWGATSGMDCLVGVFLGLDAAACGEGTVD